MKQKRLSQQSTLFLVYKGTGYPALHPHYYNKKFKYPYTVTLLSCYNFFYLFIFLPDPGNPFRKLKVYRYVTREGENASFPCLATDPDLENMHLETCSSKTLPPGLQFSVSLEHGIYMHNTQKAYEGCYVCAGRLHGKDVRSGQFFLSVVPGKIVWVCSICTFFDLAKINQTNDITCGLFYCSTHCASCS